MHKIKKSDILEVINDTNVSMTEAAKLIGIPFTSFKRLCNKYEIYEPRMNLRDAAAKQTSENIGKSNTIKILEGKQNPIISSSNLKNDY